MDTTYCQDWAASLPTAFYILSPGVHAFIFPLIDPTNEHLEDWQVQSSVEMGHDKGPS